MGDSPHTVDYGTYDATICLKNGERESEYTYLHLCAYALGNSSGYTRSSSHLPSLTSKELQEIGKSASRRGP